MWMLPSPCSINANWWRWRHLLITLLISFSILGQTFHVVGKTSQRNYIKYNGDIGGLVDRVLPMWKDARPLVFIARVKASDAVVNVVFNLYNSRFTDQAIYRDNCVASAYDMVVDCDLKLVDDLINNFALAEINGPDQNGRKIQTYRRDMLAWILSHELGHIILKHGLSDFDEGTKGMAIFDAAQQQKELQADAYAIKFIGNLASARVSVYQTILDITNALIRQSMCPDTFPNSCPRIPLGGVGLYFDYTEAAEPVRIVLGGTHPAYVARFLRILYLSGVGTDINSINYLAKEAIDRLEVMNAKNDWITLRNALKTPSTQH